MMKQLYKFGQPTNLYAIAFTADNEANAMQHIEGYRRIGIARAGYTEFYARHYVDEYAGMYVDYTVNKPMDYMRDSDNSFISLLIANKIEFIDGITAVMILQKSEEEKIYSATDAKYLATRFAHQCRLKGVVTNNDTCNLYDEWIQGFKIHS